jgi:YbbR domain-containing protein
MSKEKGNDLTIKIFALIIAIILWSYVMSEENPLITPEFRNIDVSFENIDSLERQNLIVMEPKEAKITVKVSGKRNDISKISEKDIIATVDLSGYTEGNKKVPVYVEVPSEVKLVDYSPKEISFKFEKIIRKGCPVTIETEGKLPQGYVLGEAEVKPQSVYIGGPRSWVNSVSKVIASVNVADKKDDINVSMPIKLVDDEGNDVRGVEKDQNAVDIFIPVYRAKKVPIKLQTENQLPDNYQVTNINVNPSTIEIKGKKEAIVGITSIKTKPIDINSLIGNKNAVVDLEIPENVSLVDPNQKVTVSLNIEESKTKTLDFTLHDVEIRNLNQDLSIDEEDLNKSFEITIKGSSDKVDFINKEDLYVELDLTGLDEGSHNVIPSIREEEGITIISIVPENFNITLKKE